jgi:hypothetical protein
MSMAMPIHSSFRTRHVGSPVTLHRPVLTNLARPSNMDLELLSAPALKTKGSKHAPSVAIKVGTVHHIHSHIRTFDHHVGDMCAIVTSIQRILMGSLPSAVYHRFFREPPWSFALWP